MLKLHRVKDELMGLERWWDDPDWENQKCQLRDLSQCQFPIQKSKQNGLRSNPCLRKERSATDQPIRGAALNRKVAVLFVAGHVTIHAQC